MGIVGGTVGTFLLVQIAGKKEGHLSGTAYANKSKLDVLLGSRFFNRIRNRRVIDFGCGTGAEAVEMAQRGAAHVTGVDIQPRFLEQARARADAAGVADRCTFTTSPDSTAEVVVSLDAFEHFADPPAILRVMSDYLTPDGVVCVAFGPTWYHPYGGHIFSAFPWAHLLFTERTLLAWRKTIRPRQKARTITECGLNKMTIRRFEQIVNESPFRFAELETHPIRPLRRIAHPFLREFCTSVVRATLARNLNQPYRTGNAAIAAAFQ